MHTYKLLTIAVEFTMAKVLLDSGKEKFEKRNREMNNCMITDDTRVYMTVQKVYFMHIIQSLIKSAIPCYPFSVISFSRESLPYTYRLERGIPYCSLIATTDVSCSFSESR